MRVLHTEASTGWGGQEIRILQEAEAMRSRGHEVVFAIMTGGQLAERARLAGFVVYEMSFYYKAWGGTLFRLLRILRKHKIQIVNTHSSLDAWIGGIAARIAERKVVRTRHLSTAVRPGWNSRVLYSKLADFVVTTCAEIIEPLSKQSGKSKKFFRSIPTGVDPARILDAAVFREKESGVFTVGTACFMRSWKGIEEFLQAAVLLKDVQDLKWVIIGGGRLTFYQDMAKQLKLEEKVHFTGHLENPFPALASLDVFALLSTANEGVSQAILQAACLKKPLIATPTGGLQEVCLDQKTGFVVPRFSPRAVADAVLRLKKDPALCRKLGNGAFKLATEQFTLKQTIDGMEQVYGEVMKNEAERLAGNGWKERAVRYYLENSRKVLGYGIAAFLACLFAIFYATQEKDVKTDLQAKEAFDLWKLTPKDELLTLEMQKTLQKVPHLKRALEAEIAQIFLLDGQTHKAEAIAEECLGRLDGESPIHADFARISLYIEQKDFQKALEASVTLKERLETVASQKNLYGWNLLRIAFLHKQLQNVSGEKASWEEVKAFMQQAGNTEGKFLERGIGRPDFSLADFITHRERELTN